MATRNRRGRICRATYQQRRNPEVSGSIQLQQQKMLPPDVRFRLRHTIAEAMHVPPRPPNIRPARCERCGQQVKHLNDHDPVTGACLAAKACDKRRKELDTETIEWLGLQPDGG